MTNEKLRELYKRMDVSCRFCKASKNKLQHIYGFGAIKPRLMLILVNPTYRNLSSAPDYNGPRFPFIGVRQFWRVLADGRLISKKVAYSLPLRSEWNREHTEAVQKELIKNRIFLTNIVKCCYNHANYPPRKVIEDQLRILEEEVSIVKPKQIIAFGELVFKTLTNKLPLLDMLVTRCYFPIGRGNPKKAAEVLRKLKWNK